MSYTYTTIVVLNLHRHRQFFTLNCTNKEIYFIKLHILRGLITVSKITIYHFKHVLKRIELFIN